MDERTLLRFLSKINKRGPIPAHRPELGPCWLWRGKPGRGGYGYFWFEKKKRLAHRFSYQFFVGPIPVGLEIDHLCRRPICMRPTHLEAVTARVNVLRSNGVAARNVLKDHCNEGHPFDERNTYVNPRGDRTCRTCMARFQREWRAKHHPKKGSHQTAKTHCPQNHPYDEVNTYVSPNGGRNCRACTRVRNRETQRRRRAAARAQAN